ncbi:hypothetical protein CLU79DRAFT_446283 [Phycomyces nitens]|nr:hypothetical protein CLU79DRAFT_446283 [Phycomyces nitens]
MRLPTLPVFPKHASPIASVVQQWLQKPTGKSRVTPAQLDRLVKQKPESLEARLATSPYGKVNDVIPVRLLTNVSL